MCKYSVLWFCMGPRSYGLANTATLELNISHIALPVTRYVSTLPSVLQWEITFLTISKYSIDHVTEEDRCLHILHRCIFSPEAQSSEEVSSV